MNEREIVLRDLVRDEAMERLRLQEQYDVLSDLYDDALIENSRLVEEISEQHYHIKRLEKKIADLKLIKMGNYSDEILENVKVPDELKKKRPDGNQDE